MRRWKLIITALLLAILSPHFVRATDIPIFPTGAIYTLNGLVWGTSTQPGFNNNFFFTPLAINESVCVYVQNNNTTSIHTFNATISVTSNPLSRTPSDGTWQSAAVSNNLNAFASPGLPSGIGALISGVSQVSINFTASTTQAGSPETANITIIQTPGNCFSGNNMTSSGISTSSSASPLQAISESLSSSFAVTTNITNPAAVAILHVNANNGIRSIYFDRAVISCTTNCTIQLNTRANANGCVATVLSPVNLKVAFGGTLTSTAFTGATGCTATGGTPFTTFDLAANTPIIIDLKGIILVAATTQGLEITNNASLTGVMRVSAYWYEK